MSAGPDVARPDSRNERILDATESLIAKLGYDRVRLVDVADEAGVSVGSLQHRFRNRDGLLRAAVEWADTRERERWIGLTRDVEEPWERLLALIENILGMYQSSDTEALSIELNAASRRDANLQEILQRQNQRWAMTFTDVAAEGVASGRLTSTLTAEDAGLALLGLIDGFYIARHTGSPQHDVDRVTRIAKEVASCIFQVMTSTKAVRAQTVDGPHPGTWSRCSGTALQGEGDSERMDLVNRAHSALLVIDAQEDFYRFDPSKVEPEVFDRFLDTAAWVTAVAAAMSVPIVAMEEDAATLGELPNGSRGRSPAGPPSWRRRSSELPVPSIMDAIRRLYRGNLVPTAWRPMCVSHTAIGLAPWASCRRRCGRSLHHRRWHQHGLRVSKRRSRAAVSATALYEWCKDLATYRELVRSSPTPRFFSKGFLEVARGSAHATWSLAARLGQHRTGHTARIPRRLALPGSPGRGRRPDAKVARAERVAVVQNPSSLGGDLAATMQFLDGIDGTVISSPLLLSPGGSSGVGRGFAVVVEGGQQSAQQPQVAVGAHGLAPDGVVELAPVEHEVLHGAHAGGQ